MVEVEFIGRAARHTPSLVTRPHFQLYTRRNDAAALNETVR